MKHTESEFKPEKKFSGGQTVCPECGMSGVPIDYEDGHVIQDGEKVRCRNGHEWIFKSAGYVDEES